MHSDTKTLLLVEDEVLIAMSEKMDLEKSGYSVIIANSGEEAIETFKSNDEIDLILMDIDLGKGMDGTETAQAILAEHDIPIVFLSSHTSPEMVKRTEKITSYGYVVKNTGITVLDASIKMAFRLFNEKKKVKGHEKRLQETTELLENTMDAIPDSIGILDDNYTVIRYNEAGYRLLGLSQETANGKKCYELVDRQSPCEICAVRESYRSKKIEEVERYTSSIDKWVQLKAYPILDESGNIAQVIEHFRDITEKKHDDEERERLTQRVNAGLRIGNLAWWEMRLPSGQVIFDDRKAEMLGYSHDQFSHYSDFTNLLHPDDYDNTMLAVQDHMEGSSDVYEVEYRIQTANGSYKWFHDIGGITERNEESGEIIIIGIVQDITEQKQAELALRENEEYLRTIINATRDGFLIINSSGRTENVNQAYLDMSGYSREEFLGMHINDIDAEEDPPRTVQRINRVIEHDHEIFETKHRHKDGSSFDVEISTTYIEAEGGKFICFARDITKRKQDEAELYNANYKLKKRLKEMNCVHQMSLLIEKYDDIDTVLNELVHVIRQSWQYPDITAVRIQLNDAAYSTGNYRESPWALSSPVIAHNRQVGTIDILHLENRSDSYQGTFLREEKQLLHIVGERLGHFIERKQSQAQLENELSFERTITSINSHFTKENDVNEAIHLSLYDLALMTDASRVYMFQFSNDGKSMSNTHEWCEKGVSPQIDNLQDLPSDMFPWWMKNLNNGDIINIDDINTMPVEASAEKKILEEQDIKSILVVPLITNGDLFGYIGLDNVKGNRQWSDDHVKLLQVAAGVIGNTLKRKQVEKALHEELLKQKSIIDGAQVGTWEWNVQTGEAMFNDKWAKMIGYTLDELRPISIETWKAHAHPDDLEKSFELIERHISGELPLYESVCRMKHRDGHWVWLLDSGKVFQYDDKGEPLKMFGTHTDISSIKGLFRNYGGKINQDIKMLPYERDIRAVL